MKVEIDRFLHLLGRDGPDGIRQWELLDVRLTLLERWYRLAIFLGSPPGSKMGFWRTNAYTVIGANYRIRLGSYFRCLTFMVHKKKTEKES